MARINQKYFKTSGFILCSLNIGLEKRISYKHIVWKVILEGILREWASATRKGGKPKNGMYE